MRLYPCNSICGNDTECVFMQEKKKKLWPFLFYALSSLIDDIGSYILLRCPHNLRGLSWYNRNQQTIYAFNKSGRHLEFLIYEVIRGKTSAAIFEFWLAWQYYVRTRGKVGPLWIALFHSFPVISRFRRAKSEALDNIYSLFKQNIKSCNAKRRRQRRRTVKKEQWV